MKKSFIKILILLVLFSFSALLVACNGEDSGGLGVPSNGGDTGLLGESGGGTDAVEGSAGLAFRSNGDGTCLLWGIGECTDIDVVVPEKSPDGDVVIGVAEKAFFENKNIASVKLPKTVVSIEKNAFASCERLVAVTFAEGSVLDSIGEKVFYECENLEAFSMPVSVTQIDSWAFGYCKKLAEITVPSGVTELTRGVFGACDTLNTVSFAEDSRLEKIGGSAFYGSPLKNGISIPDSVTEIGNGAFYGCDFTSIVIPDGVADIPAHTFCCAYYLTDITLPVTVNGLGGASFSLVGENFTIHFGGTVAQWEAVDKMDEESGCDWLGDLQMNYTVICTDGTLQK